MDARRLSYFACILEEGSITAAANRLRLSQPALTKAIKMLEQELGVILLDRSITGISPTTYGEALYGHAKAVLSELQRAQEEIATLRGIAGERFRIGTLPTLTGSVVAKAVIEVRRRFPDLQIRVQENFSAVLLRALRRRELDLALLYSGNVEDDHNFESQIIFRDRLKVVAGRNHPLGKQAVVTVADLANYPWCSAMQGNWPLVQRMFKAAGVATPPPCVDPGGAVQFLKTLVTDGEYLTLLPHHAMTAELERGELVVLPVQSISLEREIVALRPKEPELGLPGRSFLAALSRAAPKVEE
jgi:DNA-binding transcriptional LysR family regulator